MPLYRYRAADRDGDLVAGEREAASREEVVRWLQDQRLVPIAAELSTGPRPAAGKPAARGAARSGRTLPPARHVAFVRELATLMEADLPLEEALTLLGSLVEGEREKRLAEGLLGDLRAGRPLSAALAASGAFPPDQVALVKAGEAGGALADVFGRLARTLERAHALRERVRSALIYPAILTVGAIASVAVLLVVVIPAFEPLFADTGRALPPATQALLDVSAAVQAGALPGLAVLALGAVLLGRLRRSAGPAARLDAALLRLPLVGALLAKLQTARFARTLGTLLGNGVPLLHGLDLAGTALTNRRMAEVVERAADSLRSGGRLSDTLLAASVWPRLSAELVRVGEETGRLPDMLARTADILEEETGRTLERLVALITPAVTLLLGAVVAGVVVALLSAVLSVNDVAF